jgi:hypothetical protein
MYELIEHDWRVAGDRWRGLIALMADALTGSDPALQASALSQLSALRGREWLPLDEAARLRSPWHQSPLDQISDWRAALAAGAQVAAVAASMSRAGRVREVAVAILARIPGPVAASALTVRVADWVPQVRSAAEVAVQDKLMPRDLAAVVPVMLAVAERYRGRQAAEGFLASTGACSAETLAALAAAGQRPGRLWALQALTGRSLVSTDFLASLAVDDPDPVVALWSARKLVNPGGTMTAEIGMRLLGSARAGVRAFAVQHIGEEQLSQAKLRPLLVDRSCAVRSVARWRWTQRWDSPAPEYLAALAAGGRPSIMAAALQGLDEARGGSLPQVALPFLADPSPRVRYAAVQAVGHHGSSQDILSHPAPMLQDNSNRVVRAALRYLRGYTLPPGVLDGLDECGTARAQRTALSVRQRIGPWERVRADLRAMNGPDRELADSGRTDLLAWLQHGAATTYGKSDACQAAEIIEAHSTGNLTERERREIAFVAGISTDRLDTVRAKAPPPPRDG